MVKGDIEEITKTVQIQTGQNKRTPVINREKSQKIQCVCK